MSDSRLHYARNSINRAFPTLDELAVYNNDPKNVNRRWKILGVLKAAFQMFGNGGTYNTKFVSHDEHFEAVYDKSGRLHTEDYWVVNMGTYNYFGPDDKDNHIFYDVEPWEKWFNTPGDGGIAGNVWVAALDRVFWFTCTEDALINYTNVMFKTNALEYVEDFER